MRVIEVSATDFRVHLKDLGNQVAKGEAAVVVARHGLELGAFVNLQEYEAFLKWSVAQNKDRKAVVEAPEEHPDDMPIEEVERVYRATKDATDDFTLRWRGRAFVSIRARTGKYPGDPPS